MSCHWSSCLTVYCPSRLIFCLLNCIFVTGVVALRLTSLTLFHFVRHQREITVSLPAVSIVPMLVLLFSQSPCNLQIHKKLIGLRVAGSLYTYMTFMLHQALFVQIIHQPSSFLCNTSDAFHVQFSVYDLGISPSFTSRSVEHSLKLQDAFAQFVRTRLQLRSYVVHVASCPVKRQECRVDPQFRLNSCRVACISNCVQQYILKSLLCYKKRLSRICYC